VRLAEKGFLPFDEAIGIYQPIKPQDLAKQSAKLISRPADGPSLLPVSQYPIRMLKEDNHFTRALTAIEPEDVLTQIQAEFANLCNQIIVADHKTIREREELRDIVKKTCGYISIGLERLAADKALIDPRKSAALDYQIPPLTNFQSRLRRCFELEMAGREMALPMLVCPQRIASDLLGRAMAGGAGRAAA
jgi:hypothetical protein